MSNLGYDEIEGAPLFDDAAYFWNIFRNIFRNPYVGLHEADDRAILVLQRWRRSKEKVARG
jgi:hypothetical protein